MYGKIIIYQKNLYWIIIMNILIQKRNDQWSNEGITSQCYYVSIGKQLSYLTDE